ncbi:MAG TPA: glycerol-3-phosphate 1-O-acyltransferase PlsY [Tepidisphaeraceae bacterium]|jgi:glycerol-3-phosphate acyltransferase PlsY|nr:glycerol-3-phosphate 1-O-acyltransferase PlsY [Tepidisphaeraceae bacterium]
MTTAQAALLGLIPAAYILGSIPFGLLIARTRGVDPRKAGSGNIGATNVGRLLGLRFFAIVFALDLLKGFVPTLASAIVLRHFNGSARDDQSADYLLWLLVGFAAIFGHMFSIFLGFRGGKGVATSTGVMLGVFPFFTIPSVAALLAFLILLKVTRYVSVASMGGAIVLPAAYLLTGIAFNWPVFGQQWPLLAFSCLVSLMIIYKHRGNLARLRAGTEARITSTPAAGHH